MQLKGKVWTSGLILNTQISFTHPYRFRRLVTWCSISRNSSVTSLSWGTLKGDLWPGGSRRRVTIGTSTLCSPCPHHVRFSRMKISTIFFKKNSISSDIIIEREIFLRRNDTEVILTQSFQNGYDKLNFN